MTEARHDLPRVAVIGAGFGGLACAYELSVGGYNVDVFEARNRIGGRVRTMEEFAPGQHVEFGAELIGSNHPNWLRYANQFEIELSATDDDHHPTPPQTILVDGKRIPFEEVAELEDEIGLGHADLNRQAENVNWDEPWKSPDAERLDNLSAADWMNSLSISEHAKRVLAIELELDMAVSLQKMNFLALLCTIRAHGLEAFWSDSESFRAKAGNQTLASHLAAGIRGGSLHLDCPVNSVHACDHGMMIELYDGRELQYDDVVLAIPPSTWNKIVFSPSLPENLQPQMGIATKFLTVCANKFWHPTQSADSLTNTLAGSTWEGPKSRDGERRSLVGFAGGPVAEQLTSLPFVEQSASLRSSFDAVMPGYQVAYLKSEFVDWPSDPWTRCGYSFPLPGHFIPQSQLLREGIGHLHFAGEHTSFGFTGYMEGALESGVSLAKRLIERDRNKPYPASS